jgi:4-hydroxy-L-threonine phosphate dehydrogenase PdxA
MGTPAPLIALTIGDPAGIGAEIVLKAALDAPLRANCRMILVADAGIVSLYRDLLAIDCEIRVVDGIDAARFAPGGIDVIDRSGVALDGFRPGMMRADCGRSIIECAGVAVDLACTGAVDAVVAGPHSQTAIAAAGIAFDGYPSFVAARTGTDTDDVFLMLVSDERRILHVTLHLGLAAAIARIDAARVARALTAADRVLRRGGIARPRLAVAGLNPHAGEGGLFGAEEADHIIPAIAHARAQGIAVEGPFGADTMFLMDKIDAFVVMYHDQGHIAAKLLGFDQTAAFSVGTPIYFATVAHGNAADIAGQGRADATNLIRTIRRICAAPSDRRS